MNAASAHLGLLEHVSRGYFVLDGAFRYVLVNSETERLIGVSRDALIGKLIWEATPQVSGTRLEHELRAAVDSRGSSSFEARIGDLRYEFQIDPIEAGVIVGFNKINHRRSQLEEQLRRRIEELETVMNVAPVAIWVAHDAECRNITGNVRANTFYEAEPGENVSATTVGDVRRFLHNGVELAPSELPMQWAVAHNTDVRSSELEVLLPSGRRIIMLGNASPLRDANGLARGCVGAFLDITDRKRLEEQLSTERAQLAAIFGSIQDGVMVFDLSGQAVLVNESAARLTGYAGADELIRRRPRFGELWDVKFVEPASEAASDWPMLRVARGEAFNEVEFRCRRPGTSTEWWGSMSGAPIRDAAGSVVLGVMVVRDITRQKEFERALREATQRFETLANNISQLAWMTDAEGGVYWYNQRWYDYTGTTFDEVQGWGWARVHHPDHLNRVAVRFRAAIASGEPWEDTFPLRSRTGEWRWFLSRALPIRDETGRIVTWFGTNTDITELRVTAADLERTNRIVKLAHRASKSGAWEWDLETGEQIWTDEYYRLYGLRPDFKPTAERFISLVHPDDRERMRKNIDDAVRECASEFRGEFRTILPDGVHWIERRAQVACDDSGKPRKIVGISMDITDRKRLEQALIDSNEDLARFAYISSHDLQEPLRTIISFSTLLERHNRGRLDADSEQFLSYIVNGAKRMSTLVNDILQYSRVSSEQQAPEPVDLNAVLASALRNLRQALDESRAVVNSQPLPVVLGHGHLLERVFQNLIGNSIKYRNPHRSPRVNISVERNRGEWVFSVADNGIGFDMRYAEQVFVIFKRLHAADEFAGSGIGLAIVKRVVERHSGRVWVDSEPGAGSTFYFTLPVHQPEGHAGQ